MYKRKFFILGCAVLVAAYFLGIATQLRAQPAAPKQTIKSHDAQTILQRRAKRMTNEQRRAAAARAAAARAKKAAAAASTAAAAKQNGKGGKK